MYWIINAEKRMLCLSYLKYKEPPLLQKHQVISLYHIRRVKNDIIKMEPVFAAAGLQP